MRMPESQETGPLQSAPAPSGQTCGETFGRNHLWLPPGPPGPGQEAPPRRAGAASARTSSLPAPRATALRAAVPGRRRGARALARSPLALPSSLSPSSRLLPWHGCHTEPLNSHRSPPPPARHAGAPLPPAGALGARAAGRLATAPGIAFRRR